MTTSQMQPATAGQPPKRGSFADLFEQSVSKADSLKEGDIVSGTVIAVGKDHVVVDIGYKSEGVIRVDEFAEPAGGLAVKGIPRCTRSSVTRSPSTQISG